MLIWLASYPRSGNTLLRILLNRGFGLETLSLYDDHFEGGYDRVFQQVVAHRKHGLSRDEIRAAAAALPTIVFMKTHELPDDDAKAICIVRDGRASVVSYYHYRRDIAGEDVQLADVIKGDVWGGDWSSHARAWALSGRANTLVLRHEDIVADPEQALRRIAEFSDLPAPAAVADVDFASLHSAMPQFFRTGSNSMNIAELRGADLALFWERHGQTMSELGYPGK